MEIEHYADLCILGLWEQKQHNINCQFGEVVVRSCDKKLRIFFTNVERSRRPASVGCSENGYIVRVAVALIVRFRMKKILDHRQPINFYRSV